MPVPCRYKTCCICIQSYCPVRLPRVKSTPHVLFNNYSLARFLISNFKFLENTDHLGAGILMIVRFLNLDIFLIEIFSDWWTLDRSCTKNEKVNPLVGSLAFWLGWKLLSRLEDKEKLSLLSHKYVLKCSNNRYQTYKKVFKFDINEFFLLFLSYYYQKWPPWHIYDVATSLWP